MTSRQSIPNSRRAKTPPAPTAFVADLKQEIHRRSISPTLSQP